MSLLGDRENNRVTNVRTIAARIAAFGQGYNVRELLDAVALVGGSLIKQCYRGPGIEIATNRFVEALRRAANGG